MWGTGGRGGGRGVVCDDGSWWWWGLSVRRMKTFEVAILGSGKSLGLGFFHDAHDKTRNDGYSWAWENKKLLCNTGPL